jgi:hypothetical protein
LRLYYDRAFQEWIAQTRLRQDSPAARAGDAHHVAEGSAAAVRDHRDRIVEFLLARPEPVHPGESQVREAAYFLWLNAGCPAETALPDWLAAQRQLEMSRRTQRHRGRLLEPA